MQKLVPVNNSMVTDGKTTKQFIVLTIVLISIDSSAFHMEA